jgi:hypothetical protein
MQIARQPRAVFLVIFRLWNGFIALCLSSHFSTLEWIPERKMFYSRASVPQAALPTVLMLSSVGDTRQRRF